MAWLKGTKPRSRYAEMLGLDDNGEPLSPAARTSQPRFDSPLFAGTTPFSSSSRGGVAARANGDLAISGAACNSPRPNSRQQPAGGGTLSRQQSSSRHTAAMEGPDRSPPASPLSPYPSRRPLQRDDELRNSSISRLLGVVQHQLPGEVELEAVIAPVCARMVDAVAYRAALDELEGIVPELEAYQLQLWRPRMLQLLAEERRDAASVGRGQSTTLSVVDGAAPAGATLETLVEGNSRESLDLNMAGGHCFLSAGTGGTASPNCGMLKNVDVSSSRAHRPIRSAPPPSRPTSTSASLSAAVSQRQFGEPGGAMGQAGHYDRPRRVTEPMPAALLPSIIIGTHHTLLQSTAAVVAAANQKDAAAHAAMSGLKTAVATAAAAASAHQRLVGSITGSGVAPGRAVSASRRSPSRTTAAGRGAGGMDAGRPPSGLQGSRRDSGVGDRFGRSVSSGRIPSRRDSATAGGRSSFHTEAAANGHLKADSRPSSAPGRHLPAAATASEADVERLAVLYAGRTLWSFCALRGRSSGGGETAPLISTVNEWPVPSESVPSLSQAVSAGGGGASAGIVAEPGSDAAVIVLAVAVQRRLAELQVQQEFTRAQEARAVDAAKRTQGMRF